MQTPKLIAMYEKRIENLENVAELQSELINQQKEKITYLEEYCEFYRSHIASLKKQLDKAINIGKEMAAELNGNKKQ